jgi:hypothetical protein
MTENGKYEPWRPAPGQNDPPEDFSREEAAYQRERERLERDHMGKVALICGDDVIGVFENAGQGYLEGVRRFGRVQMILRKIEPDEGPIFMPIVDTDHPSVRKLA